MIRTGRIEATSTPASTALSRNLALRLGSIVLLAVAAYASTPFNFWVGDDFNFLVPKGLDRILMFFNPAVPSRAFYRPMTWTTWAIDYDLWGKNPFGWHITSILIHVINTLVVALIVRYLLNNREPATLVGALFAVHPGHPESVTWLNGRTDEGCALYFFPAVLFFILYMRTRWRDAGWWTTDDGQRTTDGERQMIANGDFTSAHSTHHASRITSGRPSSVGRRPGTTLTRSRLFYSLSVLMTLLALLAKESAVMLPLVLLLTDLVFFTPAGRWRELSHWRDRVPLYLPFFGLVAVYALMRIGLVVTGVVANAYRVPFSTSLGGLLESFTSYLMLGIGAPDALATAHAIPTPLKVTLLLLTVALCVALVRWLGRPALYAIGWTLITVVPTYNLASGRWMYIPSVGICLLAALVLWRLVEMGKSRVGAWRNVGYALAGLLLLVWSCSLIYQNIMWYRSGEIAHSMLNQIHALAPNPPRPTTIYFAHAPFGYGPAFLFNTGLPAAMGYIYEGTGIDLHEVEQPLPDPVVQAALASPPKLGPNPLFMGYHDGKVILYPSMDALVQAGVGKN